MKTLTKLALTGIATVGMMTSAQATTILYNDFSSTAGLQLNGDTAANNTGGSGVTDGNGRTVLRLTDQLSAGGSAFSTDTVSLSNEASFSTAFTFNINTPFGIGDGDGAGADGIVFVVQTQANNVGGIGGGIGYAGINPSVGIEFDTYNNGGGDGFNGNHVGINVNGSLTSVLRGNVTPRMNNGADWYAWVDYDGLTDQLEVRLSEVNVRPGAAFLTHTIDLAATLGTPNAFVGFTSGTGAGGGYHDIVDWQFNSDFSPINNVGDGVPLPGTLVLVGAGLIGLSAFRRKRA